MRCYCATCKQNSLNTNDKFSLGGPYSGSMFDIAMPKAWQSTLFRHLEKMQDLRIQCPRCEAFFIRRDGSLITEHGIVQRGQKSVDTRFSILHENGILAHIVDSKPIETSGEVVEQIGPADHGMDRGNVDVIDKTVSDDGSLTCPNCGKKYKTKGRGPDFFKAHIEACGKWKI